MADEIVIDGFRVLIQPHGTGYKAFIIKADGKLPEKEVAWGDSRLSCIADAEGIISRLKSRPAEGRFKRVYGNKGSASGKSFDRVLLTLVLISVAIGLYACNRR